MNLDTIEQKRFFYSFLFPTLFVGLIWLIHAVSYEFDFNLVAYGILPRTLVGLRGIIFSPLIHGDINHLFNNSVPLLILGWALFYFYRAVAFRVIFWSYVLAGFYTWMSARTSYHIGASGLVYALFGFIFISGFIRKYIPLIALSFLVAFLYGSLIWGILPWDKTMSWEGHFWGLFVGLVLAVFYRKEGPQRKEFRWEDDEEDLVILEDTLPEDQFKGGVEYIYHYVSKESEDSKKDELKG